MSVAPQSPRLPKNHTVLLFAPFYNRSGYGMLARSLARLWTQLGIRFRVIPLDEVEEGIDDFDMEWLRSLEQAPLIGPFVAVFLHVPNPAWLKVQLPEGCLRIMYTTFDSSAQGNLPPEVWVDVCKQMDQVWLQTQQELPIWVQAGIAAEKLHILGSPHIWFRNPKLPPVGFRRSGDLHVFRFLCIGMYQPRRRWDTLMEAFLREFQDEPTAELYFKVNYPSWHPVPGRPRQEFLEIVASIQARVPSKARIILDDVFGTRLGICDLIDGCDVYVSTDTSSTAPCWECFMRGKRVLAPASYGVYLPDSARLLIEDDPAFFAPMTEDMLAYQPHHRGKNMPLLHVEAVQRALRQAFEMPESERRTPWPGWDEYFGERAADPITWTQGYVHALAQAFASQVPDSTGLSVRWEGTSFVYHSLAHVNRQLCLGLLNAGLDLSLVPYEKDQFDAKGHPVFGELKERVLAPLQGAAAVHVRHQWPPRFDPPVEGAWVIIQPWEFGAIPMDWVAPMRDQVDEIWVPSTWVRDCYLQSGIPEHKVIVIPNGVDADVFTPEGPKYPLKTNKRFKFLFLGGTIHRKGIDVLLNAYRSAFSAQDDVCLVIKGQPGATYEGSELTALLEQIRQDDEAPEIEYLTEAMEESSIASLYRACDVFVLPYRGEGFGLPIAEAMACGLPVMVTEKGASRDFVQKAWAYLIPSHVKPVAKVDAFLPSPAGFWLEEPDGHALEGLMRQAYEQPLEAQEKGRKGRDYALIHLGWEGPVRLVLERLQYLATQTPCRFQFVPQVVAETGREAFLYEPDFAKAEWVEVLLSYLQAFTPGENVALVFPLDSAKEGQLSMEKAQATLLEIISKMGYEQFPDLVLVDKPEELLETLRGFSRLQWVPDRSRKTVLEGPFGKRLAKAREALMRPKIR